MLSQVQLYRSSNFLGKSMEIRRDRFHPAYYDSSEGVAVYLVWGIKGLDRSHCHQTDWKWCTGNVVWDDTFDLNSYHAQRDILGFCKYLKRLPQTTIQNLKIKLSDDQLSPEIACFAEDMDEYFQREWRQYYVHRGGASVGGFPLTDGKMNALITNTPHIYSGDKLDANPFFNRYFETAALYWIHDGYGFLFKKPARMNVERALLYASVLGHSANSSDLQRKNLNGSPLIWGTRLRYAAIVINTTMQPANLNYQRGLEILELWDEFFQTSISSMSPSLRNGVVVTPDKHNAGFGAWHWFRVQETLTWSAVNGIVLSLSIACPVLVISTDNLLLGILATFTIASTTISVIGLIPLVGWKLGVLESLNLTLVVGLAVDYIVHVAEAYHNSTATTRHAKVEEVLQQVGLSVVSGAVSTLGAALFMLFAQIVFFMQFGMFIFCTVGFSILYSIGFFIILLLLIGPESDRLSVSMGCKRLLALLQCGNKAEWTPSKSATPEPQLDHNPQTIPDPPHSTISSGRAESRAPSVRVRRRTSIDDDNISSSGYESCEKKLKAAFGNGRKPSPENRLSDIEGHISPKMISERSNGVVLSASTISNGAISEIGFSTVHHGSAFSERPQLTNSRYNYLPSTADHYWVTRPRTANQTMPEGYRDLGRNTEQIKTTPRRLPPLSNVCSRYR